jgi:Tol biopolymer transport system component
MASDAERLARFDREARMLAAVHHPNVASIFGVGEDTVDGGTPRRYLALEYVPGESLADRLVRSPLVLADALAVCKQIAAGLEAAHEAGVVHRDLKPANVRLTPDGAAKVLDFGLAKGATAASSVSGSFAESPTRTYLHESTEKGVVLGTLTYMSPEQASGKPVDRRTDVWALGCILFECLSGRAPFAGNTATDAMVKILEREPPWEMLPAATPPRVVELIRRCLEKDRNQRLRDAGDARLELERAERERGSATAVTVVGRRSRRRPWAAVAAGALALATVGALGWWLGGRAGTPFSSSSLPTPLHLAITLPRDLRVDGWILTWDGSSVVLAATRRDVAGDPEQLFHRRLDSTEVSALPGTQGVAIFDQSPDGRWIYFVRETSGTRRLARLPLDGSAPALDLADFDPEWHSLTVLPGGDVLTIAGAGSLVRISTASGKAGAPIPVAVGDDGWVWATKSPPLPDGRVLYDVGSWTPQGLQMGTLLFDPATGHAERILERGSAARSYEGHLLFARDSVLVAAPFDARAAKVGGEAVSLAANLFSSIGKVDWSLSDDGTLAYTAGGDATARRRLVVAPPGALEVTPWAPDRQAFVRVVKSPRPGIAFAGVANNRGTFEIERVPAGGPAELVASDPRADVGAPAPSPDGRWLAYRRMGRDASNGLYLLDLTQATPPRRLRAFGGVDDRLTPTGWTGDGSRLLVTQHRESGLALCELDVSRPDAPLRTLLEPPVGEAALSPDGRRLAYTRSRGGSPAVYVTDYREEGALTLGSPLSNERGGDPHWSPDGRTVYYLDDHEHVLAVAVEGGQRRGEPRIVAKGPLYQTLYQNGDNFTVLPDGRLLVIELDPDENELHAIELVIGFGKDLARRVRR